MTVAAKKYERLKAKKKADIEDYVFGKVQPQAVDLESAVLGTIMLDKDAFFIISDILSPDSFYDYKNQLVFKAIQELSRKSAPIDLLTVVEQLRKMGMLDNENLSPYYLNELTGRVGSSANIEYHARIVQQKHIQRRLIQFGNEIIKDNYEQTSDIFDLMESAEKGLFDITQHSITKQAQGMGNSMAEFLRDIDTVKNKEDGLVGLPSGFTDVDRLTCGWQNPDLVIIAARPGMGKTSFVLAMAKNLALEFNKGVAIFSLEMSRAQLVQRMVSIESGISSKKIKSAKLEEHEWLELNTCVERLSEIPIFIDDTAGLSIYEIRSKCRRLKMQHDIKLIIVDYIQLMTGENTGNREQEVGSISRALKGIAKDLDVPVIALSQLSRAVEVRGGSKRPQLSDLRESGSLEQDADIVSFIYRPEYYGITEDEGGGSLKGIAEIIFAKHRNGELGTVKLRWLENSTTFCDLDYISNNFPTKNPFEPNYEPSNVITRPSKMNDDEDVPF